MDFGDSLEGGIGRGIFAGGHGFDVKKKRVNWQGRYMSYVLW